MFRNGIYRIDYRSPDDDAGTTDDALFVVRDGSIIGADRHGGIYSGSQRHTVDALDGVRMRMTVPPCGALVTGKVAGMDGAHIDVASQLDATRDLQKATIDVGGSLVEISVSYLGPLPA